MSSFENYKNEDEDLQYKNEDIQDEIVNEKTNKKLVFNLKSPVDENGEIVDTIEINFSMGNSDISEEFTGEEVNDEVSEVVRGNKTEELIKKLEKIVIVPISPVKIPEIPSNTEYNTFFDKLKNKKNNIEIPKEVNRVKNKSFIINKPTNVLNKIDSKPIESLPKYNNKPTESLPKKIEETFVEKTVLPLDKSPNIFFSKDIITTAKENFVQSFFGKLTALEWIVIVVVIIIFVILLGQIFTKFRGGSGGGMGGGDNGSVSTKSGKSSSIKIRPVLIEE